MKLKDKNRRGLRETCEEEKSERKETARTHASMLTVADNLLHAAGSGTGVAEYKFCSGAA